MQPKTASPLFRAAGPTHEVLPCHVCPYDWRVEAINFAGEGECYVAIFSGPLAEERAREYAAWKNGAAAQ